MWLYELNIVSIIQFCIILIFYLHRLQTTFYSDTLAFQMKKVNTCV